LLQAATKAHGAYSFDVSEGKGCDRHLLGLRLLLREGESHPIFTEPIFAKSQEWILSTSCLNAGNRLNGKNRRNYLYDHVSYIIYNLFIKFF